MGTGLVLYFRAWRRLEARFRPISSRILLPLPEVPSHPTCLQLHFIRSSLLEYPVLCNAITTPIVLERITSHSSSCSNHHDFDLGRS